MDHQLSLRKRVRDNSIELEINSPEVKRLREDLLDDLYDSEYIYTPSHDLDSFMKSFEDEITVSETAGVSSEPGESQPELGYLLEASDDELGLPPPIEAETESVRVCSTESAALSNEFWGLEDQIPSYDSFDLGIVESGQYSGNMGEYVGLDGLFDHSDLGFGSGDFLWRPETLPAQ
ncbi:uncharacterized protein LOC129874274 [Solanum dulcamara]|uniref:uncharacterized protein LOC129874274 n=1 Tax=Solanum dulcamara TaxID=45834 RepID=UPI0024864BF1|nr:uncharacterized protein LOC129874274 [Solanum dulcamara]